MLKEKINIKAIYYLLNIISVVIFYIKTDIELIDVLYLMFVLFLIFKYVYIEIIK